MKKAIKMLKAHLKELKRQKKEAKTDTKQSVKLLIEITEFEMCIEAIEDLQETRIA